MRHPSLCALALLAVGSLALTACGSQGTADGQAAGATPTALAAAAPDTDAGGPTSTPTEPAASTTARATSAAGSGSTAGAAGSTTVTVPSILQIKAPLIGGGELDFATFAGKPLAVWFWAPG